MSAIGMQLDKLQSTNSNETEVKNFKRNEKNINKQLSDVYPGLLSRHIITDFMQTVLNTQMEC